jgi:WD40 repeat protein
MKKLCLALLLFSAVLAAIAAQEVPVVDFIDHIQAAAWSPDGDRIVTGSLDGSVRVWDVWGSRVITDIAAHDLAVRGVVYSPDGKRIFSASDDKTIKIWDGESGQALRTITGHNGEIRSVALSPDGRRILSASADKTVKVWDAETGRGLLTITGHTGTVNSAAYSYDGKRIASASADKTLKIWDAENGRLIKTLTGHTAAVNSAAWSPDGKRIISGSADTSVRIWDAETGGELNVFSAKQPEYAAEVNSVAWSPDGRKMCAAYANGRERYFTINDKYVNGTEILENWSLLSTTAALVFNHNGQFSLGVSDNGNIEIMRWLENERVDIFKSLSRNYLISSLAYSPDGQHLVSGSSLSWGSYSGDYDISLWDMVNGRLDKVLSGHKGDITSLIFSPDGKNILSGSNDKTLRVWDRESGKELRILTGFRTAVQFLSYSPDGKRILCYDSLFDHYADYKNILIWDSSQGTQNIRNLHHLARIDADLYFLGWDLSGNRIITGSPIGITKIWDSETGAELYSLPDEEKSVQVLAFSPDQSRIAVGYYNGNIAIRDGAGLLEGIAGKNVYNFSGHTSAFGSLVFSPDGKRLLSASGDKTIKLWDMESGGEIKTFSGHDAFVVSALFSPDGQRIVSCSFDHTIRVWDAESGREIVKLIGFSDGEWLCLTPDGYYSASPNAERYITVRLGNSPLSKEQYRLRYYRPDIVTARLAGK